MFGAAELRRHGPIVRRFTGWWRDWRQARALGERDRCGVEDPGWIARDVRLAPDDLRILAGKWPDAGRLL
jgi:hypothetical protein